MTHGAQCLLTTSFWDHLNHCTIHWQAIMSWIVHEPHDLSYQGGPTLVTYPVEPPTSTSHKVTISVGWSTAITMKNKPQFCFSKKLESKRTSSPPVPVCWKKSESTQQNLRLWFHSKSVKETVGFHEINWQRTATVLWKVAWTVLSVYEDCDHIFLRTVSYQLAFQF